MALTLGGGAKGDGVWGEMNGPEFRWLRAKGLGLYVPRSPPSFLFRADSSSRMRLVVVRLPLNAVLRCTRWSVAHDPANVMIARDVLGHGSFEGTLSLSPSRPRAAWRAPSPDNANGCPKPNVAAN